MNWPYCEPFGSLTAVARASSWAAFRGASHTRADMPWLAGTVAGWGAAAVQAGFEPRRARRPLSLPNVGDGAAATAVPTSTPPQTTTPIASASRRLRRDDLILLPSLGPPPAPRP